MKKVISEVEFNEIKECEAVKCSAPATNKLEVKGEKIGTILLFLCNQCILKFLEFGDQEN